MGRNRTIRFGHLTPSVEDIATYLRGYIGTAGLVEEHPHADLWLSVTLGSLSSNPPVPMAPPVDTTWPRFFEVTAHRVGGRVVHIRVITRGTDHFVHALAEYLAVQFARKWSGRTEGLDRPDFEAHWDAQHRVVEEATQAR